MRRTCKSIPVAIGLLIGLASGEARAAFVANVSANVTRQGGSFLYTYRVTDDPTSTNAMGEFDLALTNSPISGLVTPTGAPIASITMPPGYINTYTPGDPTISFQSTGPSFDLTPGSSLTFSFTSTYVPLLLPDQLVSFDASGPNPIAGFILAPALVPEPASLAMTGLGALALLGRLATGRRRETSP